MANVEPKSLLLSMNHLLVLLVVIYASLSGSYLEIAIFVFVLEGVYISLSLCVCVCGSVYFKGVRLCVSVCCLSLDY